MNDLSSEKGREDAAHAPRMKASSQPLLASFWQRLGASVVDTILIGILGQLIGWTFADILYRIGPYGRLIGWPILLGYFGLMNSRLFGGQTLGKRLLKTSVRGIDGRPIALGRSFLRAFLLTAPGMLNGWSLPAFGSFIPLMVTQFVIVLGVGSALVISMVFNRATRQGFHDLVCQTWVIRTGADQPSQMPRSPRVHLAVSGILVGLSLLAGSLFSVGAPTLREKISPGIDNQAVAGLYDVYHQDPRFFNIQVAVNYRGWLGAGEDPTRILSIEAWHKGRFSQEEYLELKRGLAEIALRDFTELDEVDYLQITITTAFDLGIASGYRNQSQAQSIETWQEVLSGLDRE